ncbi:DUF4372 domain-containing protein [Bacteroides uniformis]|uniref:DUF4372 domain-containing protein n=1 Tax=Bacteroides uniformis TaxID=820 RepID=A0A1Y3VAK9_BACUN|nr:DUF4372 domain-containing protein [Bacteroides uniformis]OUN55519.1 hypothetical protein B5G17_07335 [Bacteroides uniformis]
MMFGPLSNRESLRDLIVALDAHHSKYYHLGMERYLQTRWKREKRVLENLLNCI